MKRAAWVVAFVAALAGSAAARDLEQILEDKGVIDKGEKVEAQAAKESASGGGAPVLPDWVSKVTLSGDVRVRAESFFLKDTPTRVRERFRLRLGGKVKVNDETELGFRIASGPDGDPISNNITFDDEFTFKEFDITNAYLKLAPAGSLGFDRPYFTLMGGKFDMPFYQSTRMQFDGDLTPEGFFENLQLVQASDGVLRGLGLNFGQWVFEESSSRTEGAIFAFQGLTSLNLASGVFANFGVADYLYHHEGRAARAFNSNTALSISNNVIFKDGSVRGGRRLSALPVDEETGDPIQIVGYTSDFNVLQVNGDVVVATGMPAWPAKVFGDYVVNTEADDDDTGFQFGAGIGNSKDPGDFNFTYAYQKLETDAVLSMFSDSDFGRDGGTNTEGHILQITYVFLKNISFVSTAWLVEPINDVDGRSSEIEKRWQVDLIAKF